MDCHAVKFIGVRGSGDGSSTLGVIATAISSDLAKKAKAAGVDYAGYGLPYAAVGIDWRKLTHPATAAVLLIQYRLSEREGRNNLRTLIREQVRDCSEEKLVVEGYSQGAHAVGDVFSEAVGGLSPNELAHVKAVALIADPRFNSQEPYDFGSFRKGRNGILGARNPGDLGSVANRVRAWCRNDDIVCQGPGTLANHHQDRYLADYKSQIVSFVDQRLGAPTPRLPGLFAGDYPVTFPVRPPEVGGWTGDGTGILGGPDGVPPRSFGHIKWIKWTPRQAIGQGVVWGKDCTPTCAGGTWQNDGTTEIIASDPRGGHFTRLAFSDNLGNGVFKRVFTLQTPGDVYWG